jgi:hypothetical protein
MFSYAEGCRNLGTIRANMGGRVLIFVQKREEWSIKFAENRKCQSPSFRTSLRIKGIERPRETVQRVALNSEQVSAQSTEGRI